MRVCTPEHEHTLAHLNSYMHKIVITGEGRSGFTKHLATDTSVRNEGVWGVVQGVEDSVLGAMAKAPKYVLCTVTYRGALDGLQLRALYVLSCPLHVFLGQVLQERALQWAMFLKLEYVKVFSRAFTFLMPLWPSCADSMVHMGKKPGPESDTTHVSMMAFLDPTFVGNSGSGLNFPPPSFNFLSRNQGG